MSTFKVELSNEEQTQLMKFIGSWSIRKLKERHENELNTPEIYALSRAMQKIHATIRGTMEEMSQTAIESVIATMMLENHLQEMRAMENEEREDI